MSWKDYIFESEATEVASKQTEAAVTAQPNLRVVPKTSSLENNPAYDSLRDAVFGGGSDSNYTKFLKMFEALAPNIPDEKVRLSSALASLQVSLGVTPDALLKSLGTHTAALERERAKFQKALEEQTAKAIGEEQQKVEDLDKKIQESEQTITNLQKEIEEHQTKKATLLDEIEKEKVSIDLTEKNFAVACQAITAQLSSDKIRFEALKGAN